MPYGSPHPPYYHVYSVWLWWIVPYDLMLHWITMEYAVFRMKIPHVWDCAVSVSYHHVILLAKCEYDDRWFFTLPLAAAGSCICPVSFFLYPAASGGRVLYLSCFFLSFFLLSQFSAYNSNMPEPILTILGHNNPLQYRYMSHDQHGVKGHVGVTGVKKVIFH